LEGGGGGREGQAVIVLSTINAVVIRVKEGEGGNVAELSGKREGA
jgi:hypothetical protein